MEQQQQEGINRFILDPITRLQRLGDGDDHQEKHRLFIPDARRVDRQSVQYLVDFLHGDNHQVTELELWSFYLLHPPDGGLNVLCDLFTSQTTLTIVKLRHCDFGTAEEASRLIAALQTNRLVTDLTIYGIENLEGAAFGNCLSALLQNNTTLQRLELGQPLEEEALCAMQPGLRANRHLKILDLSGCGIRNKGLRLVVDALVGSTTMEKLYVNNNGITTTGLADIKRLVKLTRLKCIDVRYNHYTIFNNNVTMQQFIRAVFQNTSLEFFPGFDCGLYGFPVIRNILARNVSMRRAKELLALQPRTGMPIGSKSGIWYMAMAQMGGRSNSSGASAIFHILQARPAILEKQLRRPADVVHAMATHTAVGQKRRRL